MRISEPQHVGFLGYTENRYGIRVSVFVCESCGGVFTVTGDQSDESWGRGCLAVSCGSYDVSRDVDLLFEIEPWRIRRGEEEDV